MIGNDLVDQHAQPLRLDFALLFRDPFHDISWRCVIKGSTTSTDQLSPAARACLYLEGQPLGSGKTCGVDGSVIDAAGAEIGGDRRLGSCGPGRTSSKSCDELSEGKASRVLRDEPSVDEISRAPARRRLCFSGHAGEGKMSMAGTRRVARDGRRVLC